MFPPSLQARHWHATLASTSPPRVKPIASHAQPVTIACTTPPCPWTARPTTTAPRARPIPRSAPMAHSRMMPRTTWLMHPTANSAHQVWIC